MSYKIQDALDWLGKADNNGFYPKGTARLIGVAINQVQSIMDPAHDSDDVESVLENLKGHIDRWSRKNNANPNTAAAYRSRASRGLSDFLRYMESPTTYKPSGRGTGTSRSPKSTKSSSSSPPTVHSPTTSAEGADTNSQSDGGYGARHDIADHHLDLRPGVRVRVQLPRQMDTREAMMYLALVATSCPEIFQMISPDAWRSSAQAGTTVIKKDD